MKKISVTFTIIVILFMVSIFKRTMVVVSLMLFCTIVLPYRTFKTNPSTPRCGRIEHCCTGKGHGSNLISYENLKNEVRLYNLIKRSRGIVIFYHAVLERRGKSMNDCHVISTFCNRSIL